MTPQKYVYTGGLYREFRGYVFAHGKPTTVLDRGTMEAIARDDSFSLWTEDVTEPESVAIPREIIKLPAKRGWPLGKPRK